MTTQEFLKILPAYVGCKVQMEKSCYWLVHKHLIYKTSIIELNYKVIHALFSYIDYIEFKLVLRSFDQITVEECRIYDQLRDESNYQPSPFDYVPAINYLRSIGIDCDGLIEAGFAIKEETK